MSDFPPKTLWRISNYSDLSGLGGEFASARWHSVGRRIVYLAESPASALLETLVHLDPDEDETPDFFTLLRISHPGDLAIEELAPAEQSPWIEDQEFTRRMGDAWLIGLKTPLARVPSAIAPFTSNYLLNPAHPQAAQFTIVSRTRERFDNRLFRSGAGA
jgi:RES domain-containing protein